MHLKTSSSWILTTLGSGANLTRLHSPRQPAAASRICSSERWTKSSKEPFPPCLPLLPRHRGQVKHRTCAQSIDNRCAKGLEEERHCLSSGIQVQLDIGEILQPILPGWKSNSFTLMTKQWHCHGFYHSTDSGGLSILSSIYPSKTSFCSISELL